MGPRGHRRRRDLLGGRSAAIAQEVSPRPSREYLSAEQLSQVTPWTVDAIQKMINRGVLRRGVHFFQPLGRRTQLIFKWSAIVALIEGDHTKGDDTHSEHVVRKGEIDVEKATAGLGRLLTGRTG